MHSEGMQSCRRAEQGQGMVKHGRAAQGRYAEKKENTQDYAGRKESVR